MALARGRWFSGRLVALVLVLLAAAVAAVLAAAPPAHAFSNCATGNACLFSDIQYGGNKLNYSHTGCHDWCGPIVGGFPFGVASALNAFTDRNLKLRVGTGGYVKCIPPNSPAPNLWNDGHGYYDWVKVGPSPSGC